MQLLFLLPVARLAFGETPTPSPPPRTPSFPCTGCFCQPVWDGGQPCEKKGCQHSTNGSSCPLTDDCDHGELQKESDVPFGKAFNGESKADQILLLNLYQPPASDTRARRPAAVCMTGGGFKSGDRNKWSTNTWAKRLAANGFVAITIDYRLEKGLDGYAQDVVHDAKAAVRWLVKNADKYNISTDHIIAFGSSAGGISVASMVGFPGDGEGDSGNPGYPSNITAGIALSGCLLPDQFKQLRPDQPPYLDFHGTKDSTVPYEGAVSTRDAMLNAGAVSALISIPDAGHVPWNDLSERSEDFFGFIATYARLDELQCPKMPMGSPSLASPVAVV